MNKKHFIQQVSEAIDNFKKTTLELREKLKNSQPQDFPDEFDVDLEEIFQWEIIDVDRLFYIFNQPDQIECFKFKDTTVDLDFLINDFQIRTNLLGVEIIVNINESMIKDNSEPIEKIIPVLIRLMDF